VLLIGKALLNLDKVIATLDPRFSPREALQKLTNEIFRQHSSDRLSKGRVYHAMLEGAEFIERLPERLNAFADLVANNKLRIEVDAIDERQFLAGLQKIANRITAGLILSAMIIAGALMMRLPGTPKFYGYPILAMIFLIAAAVMSCSLLWRIARQDVKAEKH
jgi:predicted unusual protein kinase regulating ubiquinone biosynthesis (AarF/ABC1/UbiB family)